MFIEKVFFRYANEDKDSIFYFHNNDILQRYYFHVN